MVCPSKAYVSDQSQSHNTQSTKKESDTNLKLCQLCPRFFDQVGHETMYTSSVNKHFFMK